MAEQMIDERPLAEPSVAKRSLTTRKRSAWQAHMERLPVWFTGTMLAMASLMIVLLIGLVTVRGLCALWPKTLWEVTLEDGTRYLGLEHATEEIPHADSENRPARRTLFRIGNRDFYSSDFVWVDDARIQAREKPREAVVIERLEWGPFYGFLTEVKTPSRSTESVSERELWTLLRQEMRLARTRRSRMHQIEDRRIGDINYAMEQLRLENRRLQLKGLPPQNKEKLAEQEARYQEAAKELRTLRKEDEQYRVTLSTLEGKKKDLPISSLVRVHQPNALSWFGRLGVYGNRLAEFVFGQPREANAEGGVAPAIFGTVLMTLLMSLAVVPLGVLAALYLHEYAKQGWVVSFVRVAVNNLAGVPSIVFGVFGLGFFCYFIGGTIDQLFYPERLPTPTFGGGGILWASLTLALLTVPVVIVATEEALAAVPNGLRAASLACGATKFQTICGVIVPAALPGILTGAILAMARGAGEVAPLMITGVVKLAPQMPLDHMAPYMHFERKFMHLGFHIYDVGFQSPNVEASKPMVYMATLLLLGIIVCLNLAAMQIRGRLRGQFRGSEV